MSSWTHNELGEFSFEEYLGWVREFELPAFARFTLPGNKEYNRSSVELAIEADQEDEFPGDRMIDIARKVVANHKRLTDEGVIAFYDDICGNGHDSGMWWHDDLDHVNEILNHHGARLAEPDDVFALLGGSSILVQEFGYGYDAPCAIIGFESPIDVEHGIGWLTDGARILGTGYRSDVSPNE
ncbi:MAG: hypothetical protein R3C59_15345 [Planctomycetaceae bacterium]